MLRILILALVVFALAVPAFAQEDVFPTNTPIVNVEITPEPEPVTPPAAPADSVPTWVMNNIVVLLGAVTALIVIVQSRQVNKAQKDALEAAYNAVPPELQIIIRQVVTLAEDVVRAGQGIIDFVDDVTDGQPNEEALG